MVVRDKVDREYEALNPKPPLRLRSQRHKSEEEFICPQRWGKGKLEK